MPFESQHATSPYTNEQELATCEEEIWNILHNRIKQLLSVGLDKVFIPIQFAQLDVLACILAYPLDLLVEVLRKTKIIQKNDHIRVEKLSSSLRFHTTIYTNKRAKWVRFDREDTDREPSQATPGGKRSGRSSSGSSPGTPNDMKRARRQQTTPSPQATPSPAGSPLLINPAHKFYVRDCLLHCHATCLRYSYYLLPASQYQYVADEAISDTDSCLNE
jgi:hypothetical protein